MSGCPSVWGYIVSMNKAQREWLKRAERNLSLALHIFTQSKSGTLVLVPRIDSAVEDIRAALSVDNGSRRTRRYVIRLKHGGHKYKGFYFTVYTDRSVEMGKIEAGRSDGCEYTPDNYGVSDNTVVRKQAADLLVMARNLGADLSMEYL